MVELAIRTAMLRLGATLLEDLLGADAGHRGPRAECGAGHQAGFVSYRAKTIDTVLGPVRLRRAWYHCADCGHGLAPRDAELGVGQASMSPGLAKMTARSAAAVPFVKAAGLLTELAGVELTVKRTERSAEASGTAAMTAIGAHADAIRSRSVVPLPPPDPAPDMLYIAVDGTGVPVTAREAEGRKGKAEDGKARTREVKLACLFTQTTLDGDGRPVRDPDSSTYLATFEPAERFGQLLDAEARRRGCEHIRQLVVLGDGAVGAILAAGRDLDFIGSLAGERDKALAYFEHNAHRMHYQHFRDLGMFVGSGVVEAGCKSIIGQRLKLSGMRWTVRGATGIATLRCQDASGRWDAIWQPPHSQAAIA